MLRSLTLIALVSVSLSAFGDDWNLEAWQDHVKQSNRFQVAFSQAKQISGMRAPLRSQGIIYVDQTYGVIWQTIEPFNSLICWTNDDEQSSVIAQWFGDVLSADVAKLRQHFVVELSGDVDAWQVNLTPANEFIARALTQIILRGSTSVSDVEYREPGGHVTTLQLSDNRPIERQPSCEAQ
jgi:hypothetical protein